MNLASGAGSVWGNSSQLGPILSGEGLFTGGAQPWQMELPKFQHPRSHHPLTHRPTRSQVDTPRTLARFVPKRLATAIDGNFCDRTTGTVDAPRSQ